MAGREAGLEDADGDGWVLKGATMEKRYILMGDIAHPGRISVIASSLDEALEKADAGEFVVFDEQDDCLAFKWNGDEDYVETEDL